MAIIKMRPLSPKTFSKKALELIEQLAYWHGGKWHLLFPIADRVTVSFRRSRKVLDIGMELHEFCGAMGLSYSNLLMSTDGLLSLVGIAHKRQAA